LQYDEFYSFGSQVKLIVRLFVLSGLLATAVASEVPEELLETAEEKGIGNKSKDEEQETETSVNSTNNNDLSYKNAWSSAPRPQDMHRITTPVIITSPHADYHKNFSAIPILDTFQNSQYYHLNHEHHLKDLQKHHSSNGDEGGQKIPQYSEALPPDSFLAQRYLHAQQQKAQEGGNKQNLPKPVLPVAKHNGFSFGSDVMSLKPLKFDGESSSVFSSDKAASPLEKGRGYNSKYKSPGATRGNTHPYPYQNPHSGGQTEPESATTPSSGVFAKEWPTGDWVDGYKSGIEHNER
jgi:hypothetical protein